MTTKAKGTQGTRTAGKQGRGREQWERVEVEVDNETAARVAEAARKAGVSKSAYLGKLVAGAFPGWDAKTAGRECGPQGTVKMETLVALVRVPERVAQGMRYGKGSLVLWCEDGLGSVWEGDFDGNVWEKEVRARFGCEPEDKTDFDGLDAGFIEADSEAERAIMGLIARRADGDMDADGKAVAV